MIRIIMWEWRLIATTVLRPIMFCLSVSWWPGGVPGREQILRHVEQCSGCSCELRSVVYRWWLMSGLWTTWNPGCVMWLTSQLIRRIYSVRAVTTSKLHRSYATLTWHDWLTVYSHNYNNYRSQSKLSSDCVGRYWQTDRKSAINMID